MILAVVILAVIPTWTNILALAGMFIASFGTGVVVGVLIGRRDAKIEAIDRRVGVLEQRSGD